MWNIIKSATGKNSIIMIFSCQVMKVIKLINVKSILNYLIIPFFLTVTEKITHIFNDNKIILTLNILCSTYHSYLKIPFLS